MAQMEYSELTVARVRELAGTEHEVWLTRNVPPGSELKGRIADIDESRKIDPVRVEFSAKVGSGYYSFGEVCSYFRIRRHG